MTKDEYKSRGWKDTTKRDRTPSWQWVRKMVNKAYTSEQWTAMFKDLPDRDKWRILQDMNPVPKENVVKSEGSVTITLSVEGIKPKVIEGQVIDHPALTDGDTE